MNPSLTAAVMANELINRAKNMQEFVVERDYDLIPPGIIRFNIQHTVGQLARIFVPALTQNEAERMVDDWFGEGVE
jgi:hypothetical protein